MSFDEQIAWGASHETAQRVEQTLLLVSALVMPLGLLGLAQVTRWRAPRLTAGRRSARALGHVGVPQRARAGLRERDGGARRAVGRRRAGPERRLPRGPGRAAHRTAAAPGRLVLRPAPADDRGLAEPAVLALGVRGGRSRSSCGTSSSRRTARWSRTCCSRSAGAGWGRDSCGCLGDLAGVGIRVKSPRQPPPRPILRPWGRLSGLVAGPPWSRGCPACVAVLATAVAAAVVRRGRRERAVEAAGPAPRVRRTRRADRRRETAPGHGLAAARGGPLLRRDRARKRPRRGRRCRRRRASPGRPGSSTGASAFLVPCALLAAAAAPRRPPALGALAPGGRRRRRRPAGGDHRLLPAGGPGRRARRLAARRRSAVCRTRWACCPRPGPTRSRPSTSCVLQLPLLLVPLAFAHRVRGRRRGERRRL